MVYIKFGNDILVETNLSQLFVVFVSSSLNGDTNFHLSRLLLITPPLQVVFVFVAAAALFGDVGEVVEFVAEEAEGV